MYEGYKGDATSDWLSKNFPQRFVQAWVPSFWSIFTGGKSATQISLSQVRERLKKIFLETDKYILSQEALAHSGSTALCAIVDRDNILTIAHVGNPNALVCGKDYFRKLIIRDELPYYADECRRIERAGGTVRNGRLAHKDQHDDEGIAVSRAFGFRDYKKIGLAVEPEVQEYTIESHGNRIDEFIILASKGVWNALSFVQAVANAREQLVANKTPLQAAQELVNRASIDPIERGITRAINSDVIFDCRLYTKYIALSTLSGWQKWQNLKSSDRSGYIKEARAAAPDNQTSVVVALKELYRPS